MIASTLNSNIKKSSTLTPSKGFTIVELLVVIVVIGILAAITVISYIGITQKAIVSSSQSDLANASQQLKMFQIENGAYSNSVTDCPSPASGNICLKYSNGNIYSQLWVNTQGFCLESMNNKVRYFTKDDSTPSVGSCNVLAGASAPSPFLVDNDTDSSYYYDFAAGLQSVIITLSMAQDISSVKVWHFYSDNRTYNNTKTEISEDGTTWTTLFDSAVSGAYAETAAGKTYSFNKRKVRYVRDWLNGSSANPYNHWVEIQAN